MKTTVPIFVAFAICFTRAAALSCRCPDTCSEVKCEFGETSDVCGCCPACFKGPGEDCGSIWNTRGFCAPGLDCKLEAQQGYPSDFVYHVGNQPRGICAPLDEEEEETAILFPDTDESLNIRRKRRVNLRRGMSSVRAKTFKHSSFTGIPPHILALLRKRGYQVKK